MALEHADMACDDDLDPGQTGRTVDCDVVILGAGGAGLLCASHAARRGRRVAVLDHARKIGGKILVSGGGRCNFTNLDTGPKNYVSANPHFCKSALSRYPAARFIELVQAHGIAYHEKKLGQLFCDDSARDIVRLLDSECTEAGVGFELGCQIRRVSARPASGQRSAFRVETSRGAFACESLVVATGGLSLPKLGATRLGYDIARQFGLGIVATAPALDGFTCSGDDRFVRALSGVSLDCKLTCGGVAFRDDLLFTHRGLSGPAALQASLYWRPGADLHVDFLPDRDALAWFSARKQAGSRVLVKNLLAELLPARLAEALCEQSVAGAIALTPLVQVNDKALASFCAHLHAWRIVPDGTVGYAKAEVTRGGVDTTELSSKTMEARKVPGLYFIGEVVDVTGWLGGYNFQWAWASGWAAGQVV